METANAKFRICSGYILRPFLDECLVIPVAAAQASQRNISILSPVGAFIWQQLEKEGKTFSELLEAVLEEFEVDEETASQDIAAFLGELNDNHYLLEMEE